MNYKLIVILLVIALIGCGGGSHAGMEAPDVPDTPQPGEGLIGRNNRVIYEVNVRSYSAAGTLAAVKADLPRLKALGVDILWLMPIHPIGEKNHAGTLGSPYAAKDYKAVNPNFGTLADLQALVRAAHNEHMEVWMDWVANHTAWDHLWTTTHPDYYAEKDGVRPYSPNGWADVIQLDYSNAAMRAAMIDAMTYWVREADIDGFRCDAATFVPLSFWKEARAAVDQVKKITWLGESDKPEYMEAFDYDYAWEFGNQLNAFGKDKNVATLAEACRKLFANANYASKGRMVFLTNHDLNAYDGTEFTRFGTSVLPMTVLLFTIYDMPLLYNGQEIGMNKAIGLFEADKVAWTPVNQTMSALIKDMLQLKRSRLALESGAGRGALTMLTSTNAQVMAYSRKKGNSEVVVLLNFSASPVSFRLNGAVLSGQYTNYLGSGTQTFSDQTTLSLPANGYAVYVK